MPIYKPSELHQFLIQLGISPQKALSQNFLIDGNILKKIVKMASVEPGEWVLEIGPGPGSLTEELLNAGARVLAVEKDPILAQALERLKKSTDHLEIFCSDILDFSIEQVLSQRLGRGEKAKVIANLPYHLTTPIISRLVTMYDQISSLYLMVQDEVAHRLIASPETSEYSSFTVYLNFFTHPHYGFKVARYCFFPKPNVDSAIVVLDLKTPPAVSDKEKFFEMTRTAFKHRRKMLRSSLKKLYSPPKITHALTEISKNPLSRPEELSLDEFLMLFELLQT